MPTENPTMFDQAEVIERLRPFYYEMVAIVRL